MSLSALLAHAHERIQSHFVQQPDSMPSGKHSTALFFSLCDTESRAIVRHYRADTFEAAWQQAVQNTQRLASRNKEAFKWLRVDWVTEVQPTTWQDLHALLKQTKRNYFRLGLALDASLDVAFLEQEINANAMLYPGSNKVEAGLNQNNFTVYAKRRFGKEVTLDFSPESPVYLFAHEGLFVSDDPQLANLPAHAGAIHLPGTGTANVRWRDPISLNASRRQIESLNPDQVYALIDSSANFLASQVQQSGQFIYGHFPCFGREIPTYNALRHASSVYSMLEGWELTRNDALLAAVRRSLIYLTETLIRHYPQPDGTTLAYNVDINGEIKLGANAVSLLALVKYDELTGDTRYRPLMEQLALGIGRMQNAENGSFVHVLHSTDLSLKERFRIVYYDGEAAFGLMRLYGLTRDARWLRIVEQAFDYFISADHWKHHDHWLSYCANELTLYKAEEKYFRFGVQNVAGYLDFILKRETTYPTLLELSMAFEAMLGRIETQHPEMRHVLEGLDIDKFHRALHHRAHYLLNGFFWPELAMYYAKPSSILGSFFIRHHTFRVRIDDIEHYLSGYVAYWKMLKKTAPASPPPTPQPDDDQVTDTLSAADSAMLSTSVTSRPVVAWGGDVNLGRRQHYRTAELGHANVLPIPALKDADLSIVNLECVVATQGEQGINKGEGGPYYYRARPEMLQVLLESHIDVVTTANNHSGDYGPDALLEQGAWLDAIGIGHAGTGAHREAALTPVLRRAGELNIAIFSIDATQHRYAATDRSPGSAYLPLHDAAAWHTELAPRITAIRQRAHIVLVAVHWGENLATMPDAAEIAVGHSLIDAGADAVLGASAHVLQGIEIYRDRPIIHDAGDLLFDSVRSTLGDSGIFRLELSHHGVERIVFVPIGIGFGFSKQLSGEAAQAAVRNYATHCAATGSRLIPTTDGRGHIELTPPARPFLRKIPAPQATYSPEILSAPIYPEQETSQNWTIDTIPADARMEPCKLGPLTLLGCRVRPTTIDRRRMLWVESFWCCDEAVEEDIRLDFRAVPQSPTRMKSWGISMDHDPCDWLMPTSRWKPGTIYRDYYGLRPPYLKDWENVDLQLTANIVSKKYTSQPAPLNFFIKLAIPGKSLQINSAAVKPLMDRTEFSEIAHQSQPDQTWTEEQLETITGGKWLVRPPKGWFVRSVVAGSSHIDMLPGPTMYVAHTYMDRARHEQYSDMKKVLANNWDSHRKIHKIYNRLAGAIVAKPVSGLPPDFPLLIVEDPFKSIIELGAANRKRLTGPVVAITGSAGKTSTVQMMKTVFSQVMNVHATYDNYNSRCGTLIVLSSALPSTDITFLEVGVGGSVAPTNFLRNMHSVSPDITIITNIGAAHLLPGQTTLDTAIKKTSIFSIMKPRSVALICRDSEHFDLMAEKAISRGLKLISYGEHPKSDIRLINYNQNKKTVTTSIFGIDFSYDLSIPGKQMAVNSLACLGVAKITGTDLEKLRTGFEKTTTITGRGTIIEAMANNGTIRIFDESYNANPLSMQSALETFSKISIKTGSRKILVLGDMLELGDDMEKHHHQLLASIVSCNPSKVFLVGNIIPIIKNKLNENGILSEVYKNTAKLLPELQKQLHSGDYVFFKSSHAVGLHNIVKRFSTNNATDKNITKTRFTPHE